jgi:signal transduction histidine kinase
VPPLPSLFNEVEIATLVVDETPAIIGYIDRNLIYRFANAAYLDWFGKTREQVMHRPMKEVLGSVYDLNLPHTLAVLDGVIQIFERKFKLPDGTPRYGLITYKPHWSAHEVVGFYVLVVDVSILKKVEFELVEAKEKVEASATRELAHLRQTNATLERLGAIGQEITTYLDVASISNALIRHTQELFEDCICTIYIYDATEHLLQSICNGYSIAPDHDQTVLNCAVTQAFLERRQVLQKDFLSSNDLSPSSDTNGATLTLLAGPMMVGSKMLGVMTVQSRTEHLESERPQLIFRALCAYGAIAQDNANAYMALKSSQRQLLAQAKMVALGGMVAGVAHQLNTPIGNSLLMASALEDRTKVLQRQLDDQTIRRSDLSAYVEAAIHSTRAINRSLVRSADLIRGFKLIAYDGNFEQSQTFNLYNACLAGIENGVLSARNSGCVITIESPLDLSMHNRLNALIEVLKILVDNALHHAFNGHANGEILLRAQFTPSHCVQISVKDNGVGIAEHCLACIFDPFFTTNMGDGNGGLGLSICYNLVTNVLHGDISVQSQPGVGTTFVLTLPQSIAS